jgi:hypothetical protein
VQLSGRGETEVLMEVSSWRLALVQHRHLPARGLLSLFSLLRAFSLTVIKRNQALTVHHTRGGTLSEGRGTGCHNTLPRNSAAVLAARALVPNSIDDGVGAFEHKARTLGEAAVVVCRRALSRGGCVPAPQS